MRANLFPIKNRIKNITICRSDKCTKVFTCVEQEWQTFSPPAHVHLTLVHHSYAKLRRHYLPKNVFWVNSSYCSFRNTCSSVTCTCCELARCQSEMKSITFPCVFYLPLLIASQVTLFHKHEYFHAKYPNKHALTLVLCHFSGYKMSPTVNETKNKTGLKLICSCWMQWKTDERRKKLAESNKRQTSVNWINFYLFKCNGYTKLSLRNDNAHKST